MSVSIVDVGCIYRLKEKRLGEVHRTSPGPDGATWVYVTISPIGVGEDHSEEMPMKSFCEMVEKDITPERYSDSS